jgi:hypothetical protein
VHLLPPFVPAPREATSFDGIIGQGFLREFVVVFNYPARKIAFLPRQPTKPSTIRL